MKTETWITTSTALGVIALTAVLVSHLALTDIHGGEADLSQEWSALGVCFAVIVVSQVTSLVALRKASRRLAAAWMPGGRSGRRVTGQNSLFLEHRGQ